MAAAGAHQAQLVSQTIVNDSNWEPDGVTLQVRFCEGGKRYRVTPGGLLLLSQYVFAFRGRLKGKPRPIGLRQNIEKPSFVSALNVANRISQINSSHDHTTAIALMKCFGKFMLWWY